jgi:hypothetical protein
MHGDLKRDSYRYRDALVAEEDAIRSSTTCSFFVFAVGSNRFIQ